MRSLLEQQRCGLLRRSAVIVRARIRSAPTRASRLRLITRWRGNAKGTRLGTARAGARRASPQDPSAATHPHVHAMRVRCRNARSSLSTGVASVKTHAGAACRSISRARVRSLTRIHARAGHLTLAARRYAALAPRSRLAQGNRKPQPHTPKCAWAAQVPRRTEHARAPPTPSPSPWGARPNGRVGNQTTQARTKKLRPRAEGSLRRTTIKHDHKAPRHTNHKAPATPSALAAT